MSEQTSSGGAAINQAEGALSGAAERVRAARTDLDAMAERLAGQLEGLRGRWVGAGATAFGAVHQAWQDQQRRVVGALDGLADSLVSTERATAGADSMHADTMSRAAARLAGR